MPSAPSPLLLTLLLAERVAERVAECSWCSVGESVCLWLSASRRDGREGHAAESDPTAAEGGAGGAKRSGEGRGVVEVIPTMVL